MRKIILLLLTIFLSARTFAKNYYFSSSSGSDFYTSTQAQSPLTPWKSIDKLNHIMTMLNGDDSILFKRGDTFSGGILITRSGWSSDHRIIFGAYGKGAAPEISGLNRILHWVRVKENIWKTTCESCNSETQHILINGITQPLGRYPNSNEDSPYITIVKHDGRNSITADDNLNNVDWRGAEVVVRSKRWILDKGIVKTQDDKTLTLFQPITYEPTNGFGFFIQKSIYTLDRNGEWFYDKASKSILLYTQADPNQQKVEISVQPNLISVTGQGNIIIEDLSFSGALKNAIDIRGGYGIEIKNCKILNSGTNGISATYSSSIILNGNYFNNTLNNAIDFNSCTHVGITNNLVKNTALFAGMGGSGDSQYNAMTLTGTDYQVLLNRIDSVGYLGISFWCEKILIKNNFVTNFCLNKDDGGGIYTFSNGSKIFTDQQIVGNIISEGRGAPHGTPLFDYVASGIYLDDRSANVFISDNIISHCGFSGIYIRNSNAIKVLRNTLFNNRNQLRFLHDSAANTVPITNCEIRKNIFLSTSPNQYALTISTIDGIISGIGKFNDNYYGRVTRDSSDIVIENYTKEAYGLEVLSLPEWKKKYSEDSTSVQHILGAEAFEVGNLVSANLIRNEAFNNLRHWHCWADHNNGQIEIDEKNKALGTGLKLTFSPLSGKTDARAFVISNSFETKKGVQYLLYFSAKGSMPGMALALNVRRAKGLFNELNEKAFFNLDTLVRYYQYVFTSKTNEDEARIEFEMMESPYSTWLGNVELYEASVTNADSNDFIRFEYNSQNRIDTIQLDGEYVDIFGKIYSSAIELKPFSSIILFSKNNLHVQSIINPLEFQLVRLETHKLSNAKYYFVFISLCVGGFLFAYRRNKIIVVSGIIFLLAIITFWICFPRNKSYTTEGAMYLSREKLIVNKQSYALDSIVNLSIAIGGYKGQHLFPLRADRTTDGADNYITFKTKRGKEETLQFQMNRFKDIDDLKKLVKLWKDSGCPATVQVAVEWI